MSPMLAILLLLVGASACWIAWALLYEALLYDVAPDSRRRWYVVGALVAWFAHIAFITVASTRLLCWLDG